jgi:hypothetical protein
MVQEKASGVCRCWTEEEEDEEEADDEELVATRKGQEKNRRYCWIAKDEE